MPHFYDKDYPLDREVSYLLDKQDNLKQQLTQYNQKVESLEYERDKFLLQLKNQDKISQLNQVKQLFEETHYIDVDKPDFVPVDIDPTFDVIDIEEEYDIIEHYNPEEKPIELEDEPEDELEDELKDKLKDKQGKVSVNILTVETIERIQKVVEDSKDQLFEAIVNGQKEWVLLEEGTDFLAIGGKKFINLKNGSEILKIMDHKQEVYQAIKDYIKTPQQMCRMGMTPTLQETPTYKIKYTWA